jgi:ectoine hydroxylase-related dioxygenase (phytanoyl-CoA dioxygenase family)
MRVPNQHVEEFFDQGFTLVPGFLGADELAAAQAALWRIYPRPGQFFADPGAYPSLREGPFAGLHNIPFSQYDLNRLALHDDLADVARRILGNDDVRLYKAEVWAKYAGDVDYEQHLHRDYGNHMLVVPRADGYGRQLNTHIYLCDVNEANGATAIVPVEHARHIRLGLRRLAPGVLAEHERRLCGPAGSLVLYSADVFHRGTGLREADATRFTMLCDYKRGDTPWVSKHAFGHHGNRAEMEELVIRSTPAQRTLLDIPPPGHEYWDSQTLDDMELRYPGIDTLPYRQLLA